jgi:glycerate kinase
MISVRNAAGDAREVAVGILDDGSGVVEVAEIVGITDAVGMATPVGRRSTLGVGDAIHWLLDEGCREIHVGLGGSSTNDAGAGMLVALGLGLFDGCGDALEPYPEDLGRVACVDASGLDPRLRECRISVLSDVENPLCGETGATAVFGPQKGVSSEDGERLDGNLRRFAALLEAAFGREARELSGSGAAGGLGFGLRMLGAEVRSGGAVVADLVGLDGALMGADWALTGEGRSDAQTLHGKTPYVVCQRALALGVPTTLLSGSVDVGALREGFAGCFSVVPGPMTLAAAIVGAEALVADAAEQVGRLWAAARSR